jgi:hypothetical protein
MVFISCFYNNLYIVVMRLNDMAVDLTLSRLNIMYRLADNFLSSGEGDIQQTPIVEVKKVIREICKRNSRWQMGFAFKTYNGSEQGAALGRLMRIRDVIYERIQELPSGLESPKAYESSAQEKERPAQTEVRFGENRKGQRTFWWQED